MNSVAITDHVLLLLTRFKMAIDEGSTISDYSSKNDGMDYDGQQHVASGSGTAEGYSREGSDVDVRLNHHHHADPARGAQASLFASRIWLQ